MGASSDQQRRGKLAWLRALGREELPERVEIDGRAYRRVCIFKHDFFAATGKYEAESKAESRKPKAEKINVELVPGNSFFFESRGTGFQPVECGLEAHTTRRISSDVTLASHDGPEAEQVVIKIYRVASLFGLPMRWSGRWQAGHEARMYRLLAGVEGVPRFCGRVGATGFAHAYVEGHQLGRGEGVNDSFFPRLARILDDVHARGAAYVDLEKRENILVGDDGAPWLIDFQISFHWPWRIGGASWPVRTLRRVFQNGDRYHLLKHRRRLRPDQLTEEEMARATRVPAWVRVHRFFFRPFTVVRRRVLVMLGARKGAGREGEVTRV